MLPADQSCLQSHCSCAQAILNIFFGDSGETSELVLRAWEAQKPLLPPADWRAPPPAGFVDAQGMRRIEEEPWRPVRAQHSSCRPLSSGVPPAASCMLEKVLDRIAVLEQFLRWRVFDPGAIFVGASHTLLVACLRRIWTMQQY